MTPRQYQATRERLGLTHNELAEDLAIHPARPRPRAVQRLDAQSVPGACLPVISRFSGKQGVRSHHGEHEKRIGPDPDWLGANWGTGTLSTARARMAFLTRGAASSCR